MKTQLTKRILGIVLCLAMLMTYIPTVILAAEGDVASVTTAEGTQTYADLASAFAAAAQAENSVLTLLADTATSSDVCVDGGKFTVDLNGKTWTANSRALVITGADMLITDSTADGQGKIVGTGGDIIMLGDGTKLEIAGGTVENTADFCIETQYNGNPTDAQFTLSGGKLITAGWAAIKVCCASVTIKGGKIETQGDGEFHGDDHNYYSGLLDFSQHPDPTGIAVINCAGKEIIPGDTTIKLPAGYCFYEQRGNQPVAALPAGDYVSCIIGKAPVCTCEEKCSTDSINSACALCSADITACTGQEAASENTLYFNNNVGWDQVYIYYWKNADALVTWPGVLMTQVEENIYAYDVPKDAEYVLFNNGGSSQTADQVVPTADKNCYDASADAWTTYGTPAVSAITLYFKNTGNWDKVNVFYWHDDKLPISWPGVAMKQADNGLYYCDIPSNAKYVIFNNGNTQTQDLNAPTNGKTLYDYSADTWYCYPHIFENGACINCNITGGYCGDASNTGGEYSVWWTFEDGVLTISGSGKMADYRLQTDLPYYSFASQVTTAVVEEGVTHLGKIAFGYGFVNLTKVTLPESMESIGAFAFWNAGITGIQLPEKLTKIDESTFASCTYLQTITIPNNVLSVEYGAFEGSGLEKIHIPGNVKTIGQYAFSNSALKQVTIAEGVETIGESAFYRTPLTSIVIPKSMTQIADYALGMCEDLTKITFHCSDVYIGPNVFQRYGSAARTVSVPCYAVPLQTTLQERADLWDVTFAYHHSPNEDGYVTAQNEHYYTCLECGHIIAEAHDIADDGICECGLQAQAKIGNTYYLTLAQAAQAVTADSNTIDVLTDVTIGADETLTFVVYAKLNVAEGKNITCNGTVKIGEAEGIIFENTLYYHGGDITNGGGYGTLIYDFSRHIYYKAGNGYMLVIPATDTKTAALELHNANCTDQRGAQDEESLIGANEALTIRFYGNNTLTCVGGYIDGAVLRTEDSVTMIGMDAGATLTMQGGSENGGSTLYGIQIKKGDLVIQSGTVTIRSGDGGNSCCGAWITGNLTVASGAVLNVDGGESIDDLHWGLTAQAIEAEGTINGLVSYESGIEGLRVYGSTVLKHDLTAFFEPAQLVFPFAVPSGTTLTVNEGVTLDLSKLEVEDIDFSGTVINHGTILLPADFTLQNAPKGGTVKIGENTYTWDSETNKWTHSADTNHLMDPATGKCVCGLEMAAASTTAADTTTYYLTIQEALDAAAPVTGATVTLLRSDENVTGLTLIGGNVTLNMNGMILKGSVAQNGILQLSGADLTVTGNGTIENTVGYGIYSAYNETTRLYGEIILENGSVIGGIGIYTAKSHVTVVSGAVTGTEYGIFAKAQGAITLEGGTIRGDVGLRTLLNGGVIYLGEIGSTGPTIYGKTCGIDTHSDVMAYSGAVICPDGIGIKLGERYNGPNDMIGAGLHLSCPLTIEAATDIYLDYPKSLVKAYFILVNIELSDGAYSVDCQLERDVIARPGEGITLKRTWFTSANPEKFVQYGMHGYLTLAPCAHSEKRGVQNADGATHDVFCEICYNTVEEDVACTGGTATCTNKAVCSVCGEQYGELDADNHRFSSATGACACGLKMAAACISADGTVTYYETLAEALQNIQDAVTLRLYQDGSAEYVTLPASMTLDLNGCTLTADYFTCFGTVADGQLGGVGLLKAAEGIHIAQVGSFLPIYDSASSGYRFYQYELQNLGSKLDASKPNAVIFGFRLNLANTNGYSVLATTSDETVDLLAYIQWGEMPAPITYQFKDTTLRSYAAQVAQDIADKGSSAKAIMLTLTGTNKLDPGTPVNVSYALSSVTGITAKTDSKSYAVQ